MRSEPVSLTRNWQRVETGMTIKTLGVAIPANVPSIDRCDCLRLDRQPHGVK